MHDEVLTLEKCQSGKTRERKMPNFPVFLGFHLVTEIWTESWLRDWLNGYYIFICYQKLYDQIHYYP